MRALLREVALDGLSWAVRWVPESLPFVVQERILVVQPDHLGDLLLATPALSALRSSSPEAEIWAIVGPWASPILTNNTDVDRVLEFPFPWFDRRADVPAHKRWLAAPALATRLRAFGFERAYLLRADHRWGAVAVALAGIPRRYGGPDARVDPFLTDPAPRPSGPHRTREALAIVGHRYEHAGSPPLRLSGSDADRAHVKRILRATGLERGCFVALHPGASRPVKRWPAERWARVLDDVAEEWRVALLCGPGEQGLLDDIVRLCANAPALVNLGTIGAIGVLAELIRAARAAIGLDSLAMHVAAAVDTPGVRLFGPTDEARFGPWGDPRRHRALRAAGTRPDDAWFDAADTIHPSMLAIKADAVVAEMGRIFEETGNR